MYDQQPKTPDPLKLAVALCGDNPTGEECRLAARWIAEATRAKPTPAALTAEMLGEEDRKRLERMAKFKEEHAAHIAKCDFRDESEWRRVREESEGDAALLRRLLAAK